MRVCIFAMLTPAHLSGGMEAHTLDLAQGLVKAGHDVSVITSRHPKGYGSEVYGGVRIYYTDVAATSKRPLGGKAFGEFRRLHDAVGFDVVHSQSFAAYRYVRDGLRGELGVPLVTTVHGTSATEIKSNINQGLNLMLLPKLVFHTYNHFFIMRRFIRESDRVVAISNELARDIPREYGVDRSKVKTVYNGIDTEAFKPAESKLKKSYMDRRLILSISALHRQKGVQYLLKAFKGIHDAVPDTHLLICGDGPYRDALERLTGMLGLGGYVSFEGKVSRRELCDYYNACDVFVIPTVRVEGLPLVELEAMACGKPVVASKIGGIPTAIEDGVNGLLVKPGDVKELELKIRGLLSDRGLAVRLGLNARKTIQDRFSVERMVEDTVRVYGEVVR